MQHKHSRRTPAKRSYQPHILALGVLSVISSFSLGIQTAGDVETIAPTEAGDMLMTSDMNGDFKLDARDVIIILEIAEGYEIATPEQLLADPNGDGELTVEDAIRVLHDIAAL